MNTRAVGDTLRSLAERTLALQTYISMLRVWAS